VRRYTLEEFFALDRPPGGGHYELIAGVLYVVPPPEFPHNLAAARLNGLLSSYATAHPDRCILFVPRAPIWTDAGTYLEPDMYLISTARLAGMERRQTTSADLVVEILSPGSAVYDRHAKADTYAALGVTELWLVDLEKRAIEQRTLGEGGTWIALGTFAGETRLRSTAFPDLEIAPERVFE
jgi:Uma2 family endonuclease